MNKDTQFIGITPDFNFNKFGIGAEDIRAEAELLVNQDIESKKEYTNNFPVGVLPTPIQEIIRATNQHLSFPIDFISASMLYAASVAIGNTHRIEIKRGFQESPILYLALVGRPGTNKSHPLSFALKPIMEQDKKSYRIYQEQQKDFEKANDLTRKERQLDGIDEPVKPTLAKFLLSDSTQEALAEALKFNKRGVGVYVDELAGWIKNFNRYNNGSEMEFWISAWNSKPIIIDRKTGEPVLIPLPFISVAGTIQNGILNTMAKENRSQNGFIDRILFVIPDNLKKPYWSETEISTSIIDNWQRIISNLMNIQLHLDETLSPDPEVLYFTPEAKELLFKWEKSNVDQCNEVESDVIAGIYSKLEMYIARLALILQLLFWACNESDNQAVGIDAVQGAIQLIEYFKRSAIKVYSIISNSNPLDKWPEDKQGLYNALPDTFTTKTGQQIAESMGVPERTFKLFLKEKELFNWLSRGNYEKRI